MGPSTTIVQRLCPFARFDRPCDQKVSRAYCTRPDVSVCNRSVSPAIRGPAERAASSQSHGWHVIFRTEIHEAVCLSGSSIDDGAIQCHRTHARPNTVRSGGTPQQPETSRIREHSFYASAHPTHECPPVSTAPRSRSGRSALGRQSLARLIGQGKPKRGAPRIVRDYRVSSVM